MGRAPASADTFESQGRRVDTRAILALLDRDDRWHSRCAEAFEELRLPLAPSAAVLAELFHLLGGERRSRASAWGFLHSDALTVLPIDDRDLVDLESLMKRYADRPMNFADATLVHLARRERLNVILTVDTDDFETYRIDGRRRFRVLPGR